MKFGFLVETLRRVFDEVRFFLVETLLGKPVVCSNICRATWDKLIKTWRTNEETETELRPSLSGI